MLQGTAGGAGAPRLVGVFEKNDGAHLARDALVAAGIGSTSIHVIERPPGAAAGSAAASADRQASLMATIGSLFGRAESPSQFHLAEDPTHALVILDPAADVDLGRAYEILSASGPVEVYRLA